MNQQVELLLKLAALEKKRMNRKEKKARIQRLEKRIHEGLLRYYKLRRDRSGSALAAIDEGICLGCGMHYPDTNHIIQKLGTEVVWCEFCGRIVYPAPKKPKIKVAPKKIEKKAKGTAKKKSPPKKKAAGKKTKKKKVSAAAPGKKKKVTKKKVTKKKTAKKKVTRKKVTRKKAPKKKVIRKKAPAKRGKKKIAKKKITKKVTRKKPAGKKPTGKKPTGKVKKKTAGRKTKKTTSRKKR